MGKCYSETQYKSLRDLKKNNTAFPPYTRPNFGIQFGAKVFNELYFCPIYLLFASWKLISWRGCGLCKVMLTDTLVVFAIQNIQLLSSLWSDMATMSTSEFIIMKPVAQILLESSVYHIQHISCKQLAVYAEDLMKWWLVLMCLSYVL